jgi:hypothetical protein
MQCSARKVWGEEERERVKCAGFSRKMRENYHHLEQAGMGKTRFIGKKQRGTCRAKNNLKSG